MPLLVEGLVGASAVAGRVVQIQGLPDFNAGDKAFVVEDIDGWDGTAVADSVFVANGGAAGSVASGDWLPKEDYLTVRGIILADPGLQPVFRRLLLAGLPDHTEVPLIVLGNDWDVDKQVFVRRYDRPEFMRRREYMRFTIPVIALDPYRYAVTPAQGVAGVYTGSDWYRTYTSSSTSTYTGGARTYRQAVSASPLPTAAVLGSDGDAVSRRVTITVNGPLTTGDWYVENESTGERIWSNLDLFVGQSLTYDCATRSASFSGGDISSLTFGDWPTLQPGVNTFRLRSGTPQDGSVNVSALPAYL